MEANGYEIRPKPILEGFLPDNNELTVYVVPCGAAKLDHAAPAADLYIGNQFRYVLSAALELADRNRNCVRILSALHGLLDLDTLVEPYDVKMGHDASVDAMMLRDQINAIKSNTDLHLMALTPNAYSDKLSAAVGGTAGPMLGVRLTKVFAGSRGIGDQRGRVAQLVRAYRAART